MRLFGDYHTHTHYSDGVGSIEQNVISAINKGLKQVAITDHSFSHMANGINPEDYEEQDVIIKELRKQYSEIQILHGVESNLMGLNGEIDVKPENRKKFDIVVVGYHYTYKPTSIKNFFNFWLPSVLKINTKNRIKKNTMAYINAIKNNKIDIVAHLNYGIKVNPVEIAKVAAEHETYIELNTRHIGFSDEQIKQMLDETNVKFVVSSDAHIDESVAKTNKAFALIERLNIPHDRVANLCGLPKFKNSNLNEKY